MATGSTRPTTSLDGSLFELVSRGKKDKFFFGDNSDEINLFSGSYSLKTAPSIPERRLTIPLTRVQFGSSCEFEIERAGDFLIEPTILIDLPSWLPPQWAAINNTSDISRQNGVTFGYTNHIAYFLFSKIQFYQDGILLQEYSGDSLYATQVLKGSMNSFFLQNALTGSHDGSTLGISHNATPSRLRLKLPLPFCQSPEDGGFPLCVTQRQQFRIRLTLRKLEEIIEASDRRRRPTPWGSSFQAITTLNGSPQTFTALLKEEIGSPHLYLESRQLYTSNEFRTAIVDEKWDTPFSRLYDQQYTFGGADYAPLNRGSSPVCSRLLEGRHPASQIVWYFRSQVDISAGRLWCLDASGATNNQYISNAYFVIAGKIREEDWSTSIWRDLEFLTKADRDPGINVYLMNWSLEDLSQTSPTGTVNFSSAQRPVLFNTLQQYDWGTGQPIVFMNVVIDGWGIYRIDKGKGSILYLD